MRFRLTAIRFSRLHFGFGFGDVSFQLGRAQLDEEVSLPDDAAAVHHDALDVAWHLGVQRDAQERQELAGQIDGSRYGPGNHRRKLAGLRPSGRRKGNGQARREK
ncbi:MAG: hypothetical protein ABSH44_04800 [Bryobacteraceae bacterium]